MNACPTCGTRGNRTGTLGLVTWHECPSCGALWHDRRPGADAAFETETAQPINPPAAPRVVRAEVNGEFRRTGRAKA
jgi:Zn-finger nucleic acid-binding protein